MEFFVKCIRPFFVQSDISLTHTWLIVHNYSYNLGIRIINRNILIIKFTWGFLKNYRMNRPVNSYYSTFWNSFVEVILLVFLDKFLNFLPILINESYIPVYFLQRKCISFESNLNMQDNSNNYEQFLLYATSILRSYTTFVQTYIRVRLF